jgi:hypothetical protein
MTRPNIDSNPLGFYAMHVHIRFVDKIITRLLLITLIPLFVILGLIAPRTPFVSSFPANGLEGTSLNLGMAPLGMIESFTPPEDQPAAKSVGSISPNPNPRNYSPPDASVLNMLNTASRSIEIFLGDVSLGYLETNRPQRITCTTSAPYAISFQPDPSGPRISLVIPETFQAYLSFFPDESFRIQFVPNEMMFDLNLFHQQAP